MKMGSNLAEYGIYTDFVNSIITHSIIKHALPPDTKRKSPRGFPRGLSGTATVPSKP
jgi:hypothetical protein